MQYHLNGYKGSEDPLKTQFEFEKEQDFQSHLPEEVDVLVIGAGPAGQLLGTQLSRFADITTRVVEQKPGPLVQGHADGLQCRTLEVFEAFGFCDKVLREAYWVNETCFWSPQEDGKGLRRSGRIRDTEEGLSEMPHVILNQARLHGMWLESMKWSPTRLEPTYGRKMLDLKRPVGDGPVEVTFEKVDGGGKETVRAKYVVGCDGARSGVRTALGLEMKGDYRNQVWGVLDALVLTDFPDLRLKCNIHSADQGTILLIPREGGYLARFYIELDSHKPEDRASIKKITCEDIVARAKRIFHPFTFDVREVGYWSVYEVGQRITDHFDDVPLSQREERNPRIFIAGDACHTHSAKAGQGMNVSMNDTFNLGWKLASVLHGISDPKILHTYSEERQDIAQELIDFDREMSRMMAAKPKHLKSSPSDSQDDADAIDPAAFQSFFQRKANFMAGVQTTYKPSSLLTLPLSETYQSLATGFQLGTRFHSVQVLRCADAKPVHLGHVMRADGRWRIVLFDDNKSHPTDRGSRMWSVCEFLEKTLLPRCTPAGTDIDSVFDTRAVFQVERKTVEMPSLHPLLLPKKGKLGIQDYEKAFTDEESYGFGFGEIYKTRGVDRDQGCLLIVRPDQYISGILPLSGGETEKTVMEFFEAFMIPQTTAHGT